MKSGTGPSIRTCALNRTMFGACGREKSAGSSSSEPERGLRSFTLRGDLTSSTCLFRPAALTLASTSYAIGRREIDIPRVASVGELFEFDLGRATVIRAGALDCGVSST